MQRDLARIPLFEGLEPAAQQEMQRRLQPRHFAPGEFLCREGESACSLFIIESGLAHVSVGRPEGSRTVARLRRGDLVGEMSLITGEPRSATVQAILPTTALELDQQAFGSVLAAHPGVFANLTRILSHRLAEADAQLRWGQQHGEAVALVAGTETSWLLSQVVASTQAASARDVACIDLTGTLPADTPCRREPTAEAGLEVLEHLLSTHATVLTVIGQDQPLWLLQHMDRVLLLGTEAECARAARECSRGGEVALVNGHDSSTPDSIAGMKVIRTIDPEDPDADIAWLGRHLSRTKIGLALGAGGAKGFAHVGALQVLEAAGYTVDYVGGSSIGAVVGAWLALGRNAEEIEGTMRRTFTPETVASIFKLSFGGMSSGTEELQRIWTDTTDGLSFSEVAIPLVIMAVDLERKRPAPLAEGPIWQALMAATAVPGLNPPYQVDGQRLVDAIALVPVPSQAVRSAGADIVMAINLISRDTLPAWPTNIAVPAAPATKGSRMLDTLLEVMDLMQLDGSIRHAALADVVVTPRFGPSSWRDFQLADLFLTAGRTAMEEQLPALHALAHPQPCRTTNSGGVYGTTVHV